MSSANSTWAVENDVLNNKVRRLYLDIATENSYALSVNGASQGTLLQTVTTDTDIDTYGNVTKIVATTSGSGNSSTKTTVNDYYTSDWEKRMGRLYQTTVTSQRNSDAPITRLSRFEYYSESDAHKGLLKKEIIEPGANALTTEYDYDAVGNKVLTKKTAYVKAGVIQERKLTTEYDNNRRYITYVYDGLGNVVSGVLARHPIFGSPTQVRDANNVITDISYNDFDGSEKQRKRRPNHTLSPQSVLI